jgi:hypothetical protein
MRLAPESRIDSSCGGEDDGCEETVGLFLLRERQRGRRKARGRARGVYLRPMRGDRQQNHGRFLGRRAATSASGARRPAQAAELDRPRALEVLARVFRVPGSRPLNAPGNAPLTSGWLRRRRFLGFPILVALSFSACISANPASEDGDLDRAARAGLGEVERGRSPVVVVLRNENRPAARAALARLRKVIRLGQVPKVEGYSLPRGYFCLDELEVKGDTAVFRGQIGPVPVPGPGIAMDCGTTLTIALRKSEGKWIVDRVSVMMCSRRLRYAALRSASRGALLPWLLREATRAAS